MASHRLFFALWPDEAVRAAIAEAARAVLSPCRGKPVPARSYHITLAFLGEVPEERTECLFGLAAGLRGEPFTFHLDTFGFFEKARVAWLGLSELPPALIDLQDRLNKALPECGLLPEARPFHPHLTLLRNTRRGPDVTATPPIAWAVNDFVLVQSELTEAGSGYRVLRRWRLGSNEGRGSRGEEEEGIPPRV